MANTIGTNHMVFGDGRIVDETMMDDGTSTFVTTFPAAAGFDDRSFPEAIFPPAPEPVGP